MKQNLVQYARDLRLSGLLSSLELRLEEARTLRWTPSVRPRSAEFKL